MPPLPDFPKEGPQRFSPADFSLSLVAANGIILGHIVRQIASLSPEHRDAMQRAVADVVDAGERERESNEGSALGWILRHTVPGLRYSLANSESDTANPTS